MKAVTIEELHQNTAKVVHEAAREEILVTENGNALAILKGVNGATKEQYWEERERKLAALSSLATDSTILISEDRNRG